MKYIISLALSCFFVVNSFGQNKALDSLYNLLEQHPQQDTVRAKLLCTICYFERNNDVEKVKVLATEVLEISRRLAFANGVGWAHKFLASYYNLLGQNDIAIQHALEMKRVFEGSSNVNGWGQSYQLLGNIYQENRDFKKAKNCYFKALDLFQRGNLKIHIGYCYNSLGALHQDTKMSNEALMYYMKGLEAMKEVNNIDGENLLYGNIAIVYKTQKQYQKALDYYHRAVSRPEGLNKRSRSITYSNMGGLFVVVGKYDSAEFYLFNSLLLSKAMGNKLVMAETYDNLSLLEKRRGRYRNALEYVELKYQYKDSIYTQDKAKQMAEIETRYETEKKDQTIQILEQQKQTQNLKQLYLLIGITFVTMVFLVIYILQRTYNKKVANLLETQKTLNLKLKETDQLKSSFFANISHEFRTPLSLILAPIEDKLVSTKLSSTERESFQLVKRNANRLLDLVNQLLDLSKLEAGKMDLHVQQGNLKDFIAIIAASFDSLAENKKIRFTKNIEVHQQESWYDADKLEKIINNILFNAFKFTPEGGSVVLSVFSLPASKDFKIQITDSGRGIPQEDQLHIFTPFYQSKYVADDGQVGTGLGLSLVKELVKLYGSTIELQSTLDKGTTISIVLPVAKERFHTSAFASVAAPDGAVVELNDAEPKLLALHVTNEKHEFETETAYHDSILIVEDNEDLGNYISSVMRSQFKTFVARDGEAGLTLAIEHIPNLIISDVMMPKLNGIDLTQRIKSDERTSHIPIVLLTAKTELESRLQGLTTGADDYLAKPFSSDELKARVKNLIEQRKRLVVKFKREFNNGNNTPAKEASLDEKFIKKVTEIVEENISNSDFGVEQLADEIHLSRTQLFRKFKALSGLSPNEFINDIRLAKAAKLISAKADTLAQISYAVGFNEQSYFTKRFRRKFGVTPSAYGAKKEI